MDTTQQTGEAMVGLRDGSVAATASILEVAYVEGSGMRVCRMVSGVRMAERMGWVAMELLLIGPGLLMSVLGKGCKDDLGDQLFLVYAISHDGFGTKPAIEKIYLECCHSTIHCYTYYELT